MQASQARSEGQRERGAELAAQQRALAIACRRRGQPLELGEETGRSAEDRKQIGALARLVGLALATPKQRQA